MARARCSISYATGCRTPTQAEIIEATRERYRLGRNRTRVAAAGGPDDDWNGP